MNELSNNLKQLEEKIGHRFSDINLLINALSHSSYENEHATKGGSNERLEFLGDSVLSLVCAEYLYFNMDKDEGYLTKMKAKAVCESSLFEFAQSLSLGDYMFFGKGEKEVGKLRPSTLADCFEAVIAAIYLDAGYEAAKRFVVPFLTEVTKNADEFFKDYKTLLQEIVQKNKGERLSYRIVGEKGPEHEKIFACEVLLNSNVIGIGEGHSKKNAEQQAAKKALLLMGVIEK